MITGRIDITKIKREIKGLEPKIKRANRDTLNQLADSFVQGIRDNAPLETGAYANSWKKKSADHRKARITSPMGFLYQILEFRGSKPHEIKAVNAPMLHWIDPNTAKHLSLIHI